jgi:hypothetical protein
MRLRVLLVALVVAAVAASSTAVGAAADPRFTAGRATSESRAGAVAGEFLRTINARRFDRTCRLLSARFFRENGVPDRARCVLALRIGFTWAPTYRFRILGVRVDRGRAVVRTVANGAAGEIVLVREHGLFRVLSVRGT